MEFSGNNKRFKEINLNQLIKADWNYKKNDEFLQQQLVNNMRLNGQVENIIVRDLGNGSFEIVNGNHRYEAFKELGYTNIIVCDLGLITLAQAKMCAYVTNETRFQNDEGLLFRILKDISSEISFEELTKIAPVDELLLKHQIESLDFNFENLNNKIIGETNVNSPEPQSEQQYSSGSSGYDPVVNETKERTVILKLPNDIADELENTFRRLNKLMHPEDFELHVSNTMAVQAILQIIAETDDSRFV